MAKGVGIGNVDGWGRGDDKERSGCRVMWRWLADWRRRRRLRRGELPEELWRLVLAQPPQLFAGLAPEELARLRELTSLFLAEKTFFGANGLPVTPLMRATIAVQACLPILNLGLGCYAGWRSIVLYEDSFVARREEIDGDGIVHSGEEVLAGESWEGGPVVLSWADCAPEKLEKLGSEKSTEKSGSDPNSPCFSPANVIIHEFAHKLDMGSGTINGTPPLPRAINGADWDAAMGAALDSLRADLEAGREPPIDEYAAYDPGEFFAVCSEYFFMAPAHLQQVWPEVYRLLTIYYRQDPHNR